MRTDWPLSVSRALLWACVPGPICPLQLPETYVLPHVIFGAHQVFQVCSKLLVLPLQLLLGLQRLLKGPCQGQRFGFFLSGLGFSPVPLFCIASRDALFFCQQLCESRAQ